MDINVLYHIFYYRLIGFIAHLLRRWPSLTLALSNFSHHCNFETRGCGKIFTLEYLQPRIVFRNICKRLILYGQEKTGSVDARGVLGRLDSDRAFSLEQFDWERRRCDGCF